MPMNVDKVDAYLTRRSIYATNIFSKKQKAKIVKDSASRITNNVKMNHFAELVFYTIDKMSPVIKKYPTFGKLILTSSEKLIKLAGNISK